MTKLDCNVVNCSYNEDNCCRREDIHVEGMKAKMPSETSCGSFAARGCGCATNKMGEPEKDTNVACDATECKFNREKACSASHIGISGGHADSCKETECGSFECSC
ncbi:MAG: DUF1540 domain-containing protein [Agathobacter sp.]|jgi:hypothetical protein|nr:DUF1540 domain-containing protein [Agathobacter sp.]